MKNNDQQDDISKRRKHLRRHPMMWPPICKVVPGKQLGTLDNGREYMNRPVMSAKDINIIQSKV